MMRLFKVFVYFLFVFKTQGVSENLIKETYVVDDTIGLLLQEIMIKTLQPYKCVVVMTDPIYSDVLDKTWFKRFGMFITFLMINVEENEDLYSPNNTTQDSLEKAKDNGCQLYMILITNGIQVSRFLQFGDRYRAVDTLAYYILLHDKRLFENSMFYIWKKIINVIFIKKYLGKNSQSGKNFLWFEISTVPFPIPITSILVPWRLDIWTQSQFRTGKKLFRDKTSDLQNQTLKIAAFAHVPGVTKSSATSQSVRASINLGDNNNETITFFGTEIEILVAVSKAMNFKCEVYEPDNIDEELWGKKILGGKYTGLIGEVVNSKADFAVGDLYYTPYLLNLMDLSIPYNTECLTFLTPESLTDNSWKTLILPFKPLMWTSVFIALAITALAFHFLARFHIHVTNIKKESKLRTLRDTSSVSLKKKKVLTLSLYPKIEKTDSNTKYTMMKEKYKTVKDETDPVGLYQFSEPINSALYTYSMLLLVSLPKLPTGWSLRMLTGWYWLYCLLLVTSYRASMTAILAKPTPKVTIDTLGQLVSSKLIYGGWGEINREFFKQTSDPTIQMISENFVMVNSSEEAVDKVVEGSFAFYENTYFLKDALVKRQQRYKFQLLDNNTTTSNNKSDTEKLEQDIKNDRSLHIMSDCIINMPVSIGLQKNSPIKPRVDKYIRRVLETGLIKKWLEDVMRKVFTLEVHEKARIKAYMNIKKFTGALVALLVGYFLSILVLSAELIYFHFYIKKDPNFNKYSKSIEVDNNKCDFIQ